MDTRKRWQRGHLPTSAVAMWSSSAAGRAAKHCCTHCSISGTTVAICDARRAADHAGAKHNTHTHTHTPADRLVGCRYARLLDVVRGHVSYAVDYDRWPRDRQDDFNNLRKDGVAQTLRACADVLGCGARRARRRSLR